ncbi:MAG: hypothetical protein IPL16_07050 [Ignavibacteria bacterium]|nr:hypothetical protein [Ignavibacteria bacterium]
MSKTNEKIFLILSDLLFINLAWIFYYFFRVESGWIKYANPPSFLIPLIVVYIYWLIIFSFAGLYEHWFVRSRFDEFASVFKAVSFGCFILFFLIFIDDFMNNAPIISRFLILIYWIVMVTSVSTGRIIIRSIQRNLLQKGIGQRNTFIIGIGEKASELRNMINRFPQLGYRILGLISPDVEKEENSAGRLENIPEANKG